MEMIVVVGMLTLIMAVVFATIVHVQGRSHAEVQRLDTTESAREFIDQIDRDLRNSGYPSIKMYSPTSSATLASSIVAAGMTAVSTTELRFEADIDGTGTVNEVRYQLTPGTDGNCPCIMRRSAVPKVGGSFSYQQALGNVINSTGVGSPWSLSGTAPNGVANDVVYAGFKTSPLFQYFDSNNNQLFVPTDLTGGVNPSTAAQVAYVVVTVNVLSTTPDRQTGLRSGTTLQTAVKLANLP